MVRKRRDDALVNARTIGLLIACAIAGLWLFGFWSGYGIGTDIAHAYYGTKG